MDWSYITLAAQICGISFILERSSMAFTWVFISCGVLLLSPPVTSGREVRARNGHQLKSLHWLCAYINLTDSGSYLPLGILTSNIRQGLPVGQCKYIFVLVSYGFFISRVCDLHSFYVHCDFTSTNYLHRCPSVVCRRNRVRAVARLSLDDSFWYFILWLYRS